MGDRHTRNSRTQSKMKEGRQGFTFAGCFMSGHFFNSLLSVFRCNPLRNADERMKKGGSKYRASSPSLCCMNASRRYQIPHKYCKKEDH